MVRVILAPTLDLARPYAPVYPCRGCDTLCMGCAPAGATADLTIEAEYGSTVIEGRRYTAAHHQPVGSPYAGDHVVDGGRPSPCVDDAIPELREGTILLSHLDLDSVGGVLRALPVFRRLFHSGRISVSRFFELAAYIDVRGPHRLDGWCSAAAGVAQMVATGDSPPWRAMDTWTREAEADANARRQLRAYWAWAKTRPRFPRDAVSDVTAEIKEHGMTLALLLREEAELEDRARMGHEAVAAYDGEEPSIDAIQDATRADEQARAELALWRELMTAGAKLAEEEADLNAESFVELHGDAVIYRASDQFVSALYTTPADMARPGAWKPNHAAKAVVAYNTKTLAVTVSLAEPVEGVSCRALVQALWGPDAGGHDGIAGSPRGVEMTEAAAADAVEVLLVALHEGGEAGVRRANEIRMEVMRAAATCGHCGGGVDECERASSPGGNCVAQVRAPSERVSDLRTAATMLRDAQGADLVFPVDGVSVDAAIAAVEAADASITGLRAEVDRLTRSLLHAECNMICERSTEIADDVREAVDGVNEIRARHGLAPLVRE